VCLLVDLECIRQVFLNAPDAFGKPEALKASNRGYWGEGLTTLEGGAWQARRRLMQPLFHRAELAKLAPAIVACTRDMVASWRPEIPLRVAQAWLSLVTRIAARTVLGADLDEHAGGLLPAREARGVEYVVPLLQDDSGAVPIVRPRAGRRMPRAVEAIEARLSSTEPRDDMLSWLLREARRTGCPLSARDVIDEAMQLLFAGHLNTPRALQAVWSGMADHPDVERQILAEIDETLAGRAPGPDDLARMPYGEQVIKEAMRVNTPSGPSLQREVLEPLELGGYTLEPGTLVWVDCHLVHHDPRYFEEPQRFWPERFDKERTHRIPKQAFLPFGAGPQTCIGHGLAMMQMQLILTVVSQSYRLAWALGGADRSRMQVIPRRSTMGSS
jgi:cytochrome P450